ncbi:hypothetical protein T05_13332 [Trichinella murrelli]|uniref:Uncharacterized protein n=1 Tax=Trichinella murrelli TaxID=144512 RepID=A0A0V0TC62_9BILA|nr:hypothetical protein T05_13332 [Trichinella murrelli]
MVGIPNLATHVDRNARHTVSVDVLVKGTTSGQRVKRSITENPRDGGSGPTISGISQTKRHSRVFKKAERCRDGRLRNIFFRHRDLLIGADQVFGCFFGTMWSGDAQLLLDGRMMPRSSRMSNSFLASSSRSGGNRRGLAKTGGPCVRMWCCIEWVGGLLVLKQDVRDGYFFKTLRL